jgi:hypothetical protein
MNIKLQLKINLTCYFWAENGNKMVIETLFVNNQCLDQIDSCDMLLRSSSNATFLPGQWSN